MEEIRFRLVSVGGDAYEKQTVFLVPRKTSLAKVTKFVTNHLVKEGLSGSVVSRIYCSGAL